MIRFLGIVLVLSVVSFFAFPASTRNVQDDGQILFSLETRMGQVLDGEFPHYRCEVLDIAPGIQQVRLRLYTQTVEIKRHARYTKLMRSENFFDADHHPHIDFISDRYSASLLQTGGQLTGKLTIKGQSRYETLQIAPSTCPETAPQTPCDIVVSGTINRDHYGISRWGFALKPEVKLVMRIAPANHAHK